jgi:hypothetical protein
MIQKIALTLAAFASTLIASQPTYSVAVGHTYAQGNYDTADFHMTNATRILVGMNVAGFSLHYSTAYISTGSIAPQTVDVASTNPDFGDHLLSAAYSFRAADLLSISLGGNTKLPSFESSLTTGQIDYSAYGTVAIDFGAWTLYERGEYTWLGDTASTTFEDVITSHTGFGLRSVDSFMGVAYEYKTPFIKGQSETQYVAVMFNFFLNEKTYIDLTYKHGITTNIAANDMTAMIGHTF